MTDREAEPRRTLLLRPWIATTAAMDALFSDARRSRLAVAGIALVASWYVYVPVHELLHALGCAATGGTVTTLELQRQYGGGWLAEVLPFVEPGGEYAGRLSDFDTHGSDWVYLATDALPFALSVLVGVPLLRACGRAARPLLFGPAVVVGLAPFYNLPGDYYEMGSILVTGAMGTRWHALRSDDLLRTLAEAPLDAATAGVVGLSLVVALALAYATWEMGDRLALRWIRPPAPPRGRRPRWGRRS